MTVIMEIRTALDRCVRFLCANQRVDGGFARQPDEPSDAWTTAEVILALQGLSEQATATSNAQDWLLANQLGDGSWRALAYANLAQGQGDVAATSYSVRALILSGTSSNHDKITRARTWLLQSQRSDGGWAVSRFAEPFAHIGLTAYAISALSLCPSSDHLTAESIQRGLFCLHSTRLSEGGWALHPGGAPDATLSSYAVRAILDAYANRGYEPRVQDLIQFIDLWQRRQSNDGSWSDWNGNKSSVEATSYIIEIMSCLYPDSTDNLMASNVVNAGVSFLLNNQNADGGYPIMTGGPSSPWATHNVVLAMRGLLRDPKTPSFCTPTTFFPPISGPAIISHLEKYDVSISFESEHRTFAELLAFRLNMRGVSVFYDKLNQERLWGSNLPEVFENAFARASEFCIVLISKAYLSKPWPLFELSQLQTRLVFEKRGSILPVIMSDDVDPPDYLRTIGYLKSSEMNVEDIVELVVKKVGTSKMS